MFGTVVDQLECAIDAAAALVASVETVEVSRAESLDMLLALERLGERLEATVCGLATDLEVRDAHRADVATSMANWLAARTGQARSTTGSRLHLARKLRSMPATSAAVAAGDITHSHAHVLARALNPRTVGAFARDEAMLVATATKLTADQLVQVIEFWLRHNDPDGTEPGEEGGRDRALGKLCTRAATSAKNPARRQPLFVLHTTLDTLTETGDPTDWMLAVEQAWSAAIPLHDAHLWSCDCWTAHVVIRGQDGEVLDAGREERIANRAMRRALVARDGHHCAVPGCDRPVGWCDAHHIIWWENGGLTKVENLVFLCRWHHTRVHAGELTVEMIDHRPRFTNQAGIELIEPRAGPAPPPRDPPKVAAA